jgi:alpha-beta hydrolase superfamily lysophospholipase
MQLEVLANVKHVTQPSPILFVHGAWHGAPESFRVTFEMALLNLPRAKRVKTPMLGLAAANDRVFSVAEEQATAIAYGTEAVVFPDMAHDMMLEPGWPQVADRILDWVRECGV